MKFRYAHYYKHSPVINNRILIESFHGKTINDSGLVFAREILRMYPGEYEIYYASADIAQHSRFIQEQGLDVKLVDIRSFQYAKILATSKYLISNASLPIYFTRRDEQVYLQTWHGTPLKTLGKKMKLGLESMSNVQHNFLQANYLLQPNRFTKDVIMEDYLLTRLYTGKVIMSGYPRNSIFFDRDAAAETKKSCGFDGMKVFAYMPTWRGKSNRDVDISGYLRQVRQILTELDAALADDEVCCVNFHTMVAAQFSFDEFKHIRPFPEEVDTYAFLNCTDALVTDYSSVFFDYMITERPIILFPYDRDEYLLDRGLYMDLEELPFPEVYKTEDLISELKAVSAGQKGGYRDSAFYREFTQYDRPDSAEKILRLIMEGDAGDLEIEDYVENTKRPICVWKPPGIRERETFEALTKVMTSEDDVAFFYRKWFKKERSRILHEDYHDAFSYIITEDYPTRTYLEELGSYLGIKRCRQIKKERDEKRCFPNLEVTYGDPLMFDCAAAGTYAQGGAFLKRIRCGRERLRVKAYARGLRADQIHGAFIQYRSEVEDIKIPLEMRAEDRKYGAMVYLTAVFHEGMPLQSLYWDTKLDVSYNGQRFLMDIGRVNFFKKARIALSNWQFRVGADRILFPYYNRFGKLCFVFREKSKYDTNLTHVKEILAVVSWLFRGKSLEKKKIWLVYEKFSMSAQDNSYYFFRYCMEHLPEQDRNRIFYVIDTDAADYQNVRKYGKQVIPFMSIKHMVYGMSMNIAVSTDSLPHLYVWRSKPSWVGLQIKRKEEYFLQHGVTALKRVDGLFGKEGTSPMTYFTTTSKNEQDIVVNEFGFRRNDAPITGFARWDVLEDRRGDEKPFILVMPTWRSWLEETTEELFRASDYFSRYSALLDGSELEELLEEKDVELVFYLHPKFASFSKTFMETQRSRITCKVYGETPLNDLIMKCSMLVTDYSSVCWDVLYLEKPVLFYQFDKETYLNVHGAYIDFEKDLPGSCVETEQALLSELRVTIDAGFQMSEENKKKANQWFQYKDHENSARIVRFLKDRGH